MKKDYKNFCDWLFIASPSRALLNAMIGGCKFGYKGFNKMCKKCKNCYEMPQPPKGE